MGRKQVWKVLLGSRMATALREVVGHRVLVPGSLVPPAKLFARDHKALARHLGPGAGAVGQRRLPLTTESSSLFPYP